MLTPEYLQGAPAELEALFLRLEEDVIKDICRRIAKEGRLTDSAADQAERLRDLGAGTDYIKRKISEYYKLSSEEVDRLFFDAAQTSDEFYRNVYDRANKEYTPYEYNDYFQQAVDAAVNQTKGELRNLTQSMGFSYRGSNGQMRFHTAAEAYRDCLDYAFLQTSTGMTDYNTAVRNATRRLTDSGLQFVDYASGVRNHADVAVRRAVLTGLSQYTGKISERNAQELDTDIVEVSAHMGARPDHAEWQGRWYSLSGKSKQYPSLVQVTGYGTGAGLKGWNCRHDFYPVIPGISEPSYTEEELRNIDPPPFEYNGKTYTCYEATQRQRYMERAMRKTKRELLAAESTGDKDKFTEKSVLLRRQREEYGKFSKAAGLLTQNERTQVGGFGHSQASKAAWAAKKAAQNNSGGSSAPVTPSASGGHAVTVNVPTPADNGGKGKLYRDENVNYMSKSFRPRYTESTPISYKDRKFISHSIDVKNVQNSKYNMVTDVTASRRDKAVRITERLISNLKNQLPYRVDIPQIAVVDFERNGLNPNAIGGYDKGTDILYINSKYNTLKKIKKYVSENKGEFANNTVYAPISHELGHKYYENCIKSLAKSQNIEYNNAKDIIDRQIDDFITKNKLATELDSKLSEYAKKKYYQGKYTEVIAESFSAYDQNPLAKEIIDMLEANNQ